MNWRAALHGVVHSAMSAFRGEMRTADGLKLAFGLQYMARAALNRLLADRLAASGDGRIVHMAGDVPTFTKPNVADPNFEHTKWSFFKALLNSHLLGALHVEESQRRWRDSPVLLAMSCVPSAKTNTKSR